MMKYKHILNNWNWECTQKMGIEDKRFIETIKLQINWLKVENTRIAPNLPWFPYSFCLLSRFVNITTTIEKMSSYETPTNSSYEKVNHWDNTKPLVTV